MGQSFCTVEESTPGPLQPGRARRHWPIHSDCQSGLRLRWCMPIAATSKVCWLNTTATVKRTRVLLWPNRQAKGENRPLILTSQIPLQGVHGRFDHFAFDPSKPAWVSISALGNSSVEVIDLVEDTEVHRITGWERGVHYTVSYLVQVNI